MGKTNTCSAVCVSRGGGLWWGCETEPGVGQYGGWCQSHVPCMRSGCERCAGPRFGVHHRPRHCHVSHMLCTAWQWEP